MCGNKQERTALLGSLLLLAAGVVSLPVRAAEGYDPLRQITKQVVKANLLIVLDITGSMAGDAPGNSISQGENGIGNLLWVAPGNGNSTACPTGSAAIPSCVKVWTYTLKYEAPSRISSVKNALGNSVILLTNYDAPASWPALNANWGAACAASPTARCTVLPAGSTNGSSEVETVTITGNTGTFRLTFGGQNTTPLAYNASAAAVQAALNLLSSIGGVGGSVTVTLSGQIYTVTFGGSLAGANVTAMTAANVSGTPNPSVATLNTGGGASWAFKLYTTSASTTDPGIPFTAYTAGGRPLTPQPTMGTWTDLAPQDVVGQSATSVNWGLAAFSTNHGPSSSCTSAGTRVDLLKPIDTSDSSDVTVIESNLRAQSVGGLAVGGGTNTIAGLFFAKDIINKTYYGGSITDNRGVSVSLPSDPKFDCNRTYGVILATDGLSNSCNPSGGDWLSPCPGTCPGPTCCDTSSSGSDCPSAWASFAAKQADDIFNLKLGVNTGPAPKRKTAIDPRVWSVGVSTQVGPCELDFIAYMGRTDADSPNGDAGFGGYDPVTNPNLPVPPSSTVPANGVGGTYDGPTGQYRYSKSLGTGYNVPPGHGHNAFFATSPTAIADAFVRIINATALGDYATNSPTSGAGIGNGNTAILPSSEFPSWKGHVYEYVYDLTKLPTDPLYQILKWDAGNVLSNPAAVGYKSPDVTQPNARKIYTWDSSNNLVEVKSANLATLQAIAAANGLVNAAVVFTANVVDFIRGNDGTLANRPRAWVMGPPINTTPALAGPPVPFYQPGNVATHVQFEVDYAKRFPLAYVGSDDGMMHALRFDTGSEVFALIPPNLLPVQVSLYTNYIQKPFRVTGQPDRISQHIYGAANSLHYADVYFPNDSPPQYHTVGILTEGAGGPLIAAIDITHPFGGDATVSPVILPDTNYAAFSPFPVKILWSKLGGAGAGQILGLYSSWSVPALAATDKNHWTLLFGGGPNPASTKAGQVAPKAFSLDLSTNPTTPSFNTLNMGNGGLSPLVGNQAFADSVLFSTLAPAFFSDNVADLGLQADLDGRIWFMTGSFLTSAPFVGIDASAAAGNKTQPIYYSPAVSGYGSAAGPTGCDLFAFASGSFYEQDPSVSGPGIGAGGNFIPSLYLAVNPKPAAGLPASAIPSGSTQVTRIPITGTTFKTYVPPDPATPDVVLGAHTQVTASPFIVVPKKGPGGAGTPQALFLVYDPDIGCTGEAFIIAVTFNTGATCTTPLTISRQVAYDAGQGAASGFTVIGQQIGAAKSGIGKDAGGNVKAASIYFPPHATAGNAGSPIVLPLYWKELK